MELDNQDKETGKYIALELEEGLFEIELMKELGSSTTGFGGGEGEGSIRLIVGVRGEGV